MKPSTEQKVFAVYSTEKLYCGSVSAGHRRKFGQVFTPPRLAALMADWVMERSPRTLLDPAYGTGLLSAACLSIDGEVDTTAYEIDACVLKYARVPTGNTSLLNKDFLLSSIDERFDAVIMNPPYIRHREIVGYESSRIQISQSVGVSIPKSANLYIYFSLKALDLLRPSGRAAVLIPAEWMSANFSKSLKQYLLRCGLLKGIVSFSNCSNVFGAALTTASVLLCER